MIKFDDSCTGKTQLAQNIKCYELKDDNDPKEKNPTYKYAAYKNDVKVKKTIGMKVGNVLSS